MARKTLDILSVGLILLALYIFLDIIWASNWLTQAIGIVGAVIVIINQIDFIRKNRRR